MGTQQHLHLADIAKGIGISLVVLGHTTHCEMLSSWIYSFHMPLFFFLSGVLFTPAGIEGTIKRCKKILIPYFVFAILSYLYWRFGECLVRGIPDGLDPDKHVWDILWQRRPFEFNIALWFLPCLLIIQIISNLLFQIRQRWWKWVVYLSFLLLASIVNIPTHSMWIKETYYAMSFFVLGNIMHDWAYEIENKLTSIPRYYFLSAIPALFSMIFWVNRCDMMKSIYPQGYFIFHMIALLGIMLLMLITPIFNGQKWLKWLGTNSLTIMCVHEPIKRVIIIVLSIITRQETNVLRESIIGSMGITIIVIAITIPICIFVNSRLPFLIGKNTKKVSA